MLQNRVNPFGDIIKTKARGAFMGNRGVIHNDKQQLISPFKLKAWITCLLEFKGWHRPVMAPDRYTELFFMDEATAFAAGHRPCFECRRADAIRFKQYWLKGNPEYGFDIKTSIQKIDEILHRERITRDHSKVTFTLAADKIPDGAFVAVGNDAFLVLNGFMYLWTPFGYEKGRILPDTDVLTVLTPKSALNAFRAGYLPGIAIK